MNVRRNLYLVNKKNIPNLVDVRKRCAIWRSGSAKRSQFVKVRADGADLEWQLTLFPEVADLSYCIMDIV